MAMSQAPRHYTSVEEVETACLCMPLRLAVFTTALGTTVFSFVYMLDHRYWQSAFRHCAGGYSLHSRLIIGMCEISGILFGLVGLFGAYHAKRGHVQAFNVWQFVRVFTWIFMFYVDVPLIRECEGWVDSVDAMVKAHGWNQLMYDIALDGNCPHERRWFYACSVLCMCIFVYLIYATYRYQEMIERDPKHLLRVPKDLGSGAFYAHSTGERGALQQTYGAAGPMVGSPVTIAH